MFQTEMSLINPIMRYLKEEKIKVSTQNEAKKVVQSIAKKITNLQWMQNLLYQFLQLTTIENVDLQSYATGDSSKNLDEID